MALKTYFVEPSFLTRFGKYFLQEGNFVDRAIRVLVANQPTLIRQLIVATLLEEPGVEFAEEVAAEDEICSRVRDSQPDLLVITLDDPPARPAICDALLRDHPRLCIIAVASQQDRSIFYWGSFDVHCREIEPSEQGILAAARNVMRGGAEERIRCGMQ